MKSSNPILRDSVLEDVHALTERPMSVGGTLNKLMLLSFIMLVSAGAVFYQFSLQRYDMVSLISIIAVAVSIVLAIVMAFAHKLTPYLAPIYAFAQGAAVSAISCFFEAQYPGIVMQAVSITLCCVFVMAMLYKMKLITATERFKSVLIIATSTIFLFYVISFVIMLFGVNIPYFTNSGSAFNIFINIVIAIIAALNLIIDFDFIEKGVNRLLPVQYEWYGAFGLLVTVIWLYVEILRLLARLNSRD